MRILTFTGGPFQENGYLAVCTATGSAVAVDPGAAAPAMLDAVEREDLSLAAVLLTHAHLDHVEGVPDVLARHPVPLHLHPDDLPLYRAAPEQAAAFGLTAPDLPEPDGTLAHGDEIAVGERRLRVRHAPGHAPGHVVFWDEDADLALVGDVVFRGSIGRTDLPGGDFRQLISSIRDQILTLPDETRLLTGHGPETTVGWEREGNPFLVPNYGGTLA